MKRFLCPKHSHLLKTKPTMLSTTECTMCRWENRPMTLKDLARQLEDVAYSMRLAYEDEYYDPHGITWSYPFQDIIKDYLSMIHQDYRDNFIKDLNETFKNNP